MSIMVSCVYTALVYYILTAAASGAAYNVKLSGSRMGTQQDVRENSLPLGSDLVLPEFPGSVNCISFNLMTIQCRWDMGGDQVFNTTLISCGNIPQSCSSPAYCEDDNGNDDADSCCLDSGCCTWTDYSCQSEDAHILEFTSSGEQHYQYSYNLSTFENLLPGPAEDFHVDSLKNCSVNIDWGIDASIQEFTRTNGMYYHLDYLITDSKDSKLSWGSTLLSHNTSLVSTRLEMPYPGREYDLRIRLQAPTVLTANETMWSKPSTLHNVNIDPQVPWVSPVTTAGSFEVNSAINVRSITISWKQLEALQKNGPEFQYIITDIPYSKKYNTEKGYITLDFDSTLNENCTFVISSQNAVGESLVSSEAVVVSDEQTRPKQPTLRAAIRYWNADNHKHNSNNNHQIIQERDNQLLNTIYQLRWYPASSQEQSFTIFWCNDEEDKAGPCQGKLNWVSGISGTSSNLSLFDLDIGTSSAVRFAISSENMTSSLSSGMSWATCIIPIYFSKNTNTTPRIQQVNTDPNNYVTTIVWSFDCLGWGGDVKALLLQWCKGNHTRLEHCPQIENQTADNFYSSEIVVSSLMGGGQYTLWMSAVYSNNRLSPSSPPKLHQVPEGHPSVSTIVLSTGIAILLMIAVLIGGTFIKRSLSKVYTDLNTNPKLPRGLTTDS